VTGSLVSPTARARVRELATPVARGLGRLGLTPNALTVIGFLGTCVGALAAALQAWPAAGILVLAFGIFDLFDGALARATGRVSRLGAFLDSTFDRAGEVITFVGIVAGCLGAGFELGAGLAAAAMAASSLVPYTRATAESLGFAPGSGMIQVGLAPREVRVTLIGVGLLLTPLAGSGALATALGLVAALASITAVQRILYVAKVARDEGRHAEGRHAEPRQAREG